MDRATTMGWGAVAGAALAGWTLAPLGTVVALGLAAAALTVWGRHARWAGAVAGVALGLGSVASLPEGPVLRGPVHLLGVVVGSPVGREADVAVTRVAGADGRWRASRGRVRVRLPERGLAAPGVALAVAGEAAAPLPRGLPGAPDAARDHRRGRVRSLVLAASARRLGGDPAPPPELPGLLRALATGDRRGLDERTLHTLRATGTAHLVAISGFHVGALAAVGVWVARGPLGLVAAWRPAGGPAVLRALGALVAAALFAWSAGLPVSAQRAVVLVGLVSLGRATGRHLDLDALLALAAVAVVITDPPAVGSAAFQLSFGAVVGLLRWASPLDASLRQRLPGRLGFVASPLSATLAATLGTLPASAWWFQTLPPTSPLANLVAMPVTALALVPSAFVATYGPEPLAGWAATAGGWTGDRLIDGLAWLVTRPWTPAVGPLGALGLLAAVLLPRRPVAALTLTVLSLSLRPWPRGAEAWVLDVGQGDSLLFRDARGGTTLVDGGWRGDDVVAWLRRRGVRRLDRVVVSHADGDHAAGLVDVVDGLVVGRILAVQDHLPDDLRAVAAARGVPIVDDPTARLHPGAVAPEDTNAASLVLRVDGPGGAWFLPGDAPGEVEQALAHRVGAVRVLKVAHHGSRSSTPGALLDALRPQVAVVPVGRTNRYGHPHAEVLQRLEDRGVRVFRTDVHGTLRLREGPSGSLVVEHARAGQAPIREVLPRHGAAGRPAAPSGPPAW